MSPTNGRVAAIAVRTKKLGPMLEVPHATASFGGGIEGDVPVKPQRGITLITREGWDAAMRELGENLPWHTRRANVLVEGIDLSKTIGLVVRLGEVELHIHGETEPCALMDQLHDGLQSALTPEMRAGVHGQVIQGGTFAVGDYVEIVD